MTIRDLTIIGNQVFVGCLQKDFVLHELCGTVGWHATCCVYGFGVKSGWAVNCTTAVNLWVKS